MRLQRSVLLLVATLAICSGSPCTEEVCPETDAVLASALFRKHQEKVSSQVSHQELEEEPSRGLSLAASEGSAETAGQEGSGDRRRRRRRRDSSPSPPSGGSPSPPAPPSSTQVDTECVNLMLVADHGSRSSTQSRVAAGMAKQAKRKEPVAIAAVGDNIYGSGAEGKESLIVSWFSDVYLKHSALKRPWYVVTGNHDWYSDARVERDFTKSSSNKGGYWQMPGFWYQHTFISKTSGLKVDCFFIDTQIWVGASAVSKYLGSWAKKEQKKWLEGVLEGSSAQWKIVLGHHPVYSRGSHGVTDEMFKELDPMMRRHGVQAFIAGHDHSKHLIEYEGLSYVVNGAGGKDPRNPSNEYPKGSLVEDHQNPGFATIELCKNKGAELIFFDKDGKEQSTSKLPIAAPKRKLSGSVKLQTGKSLSFPSRSGASVSAQTDEERKCGGRVMLDVDKFCTSEDGSGCRVVADQPPELTCEHYCRQVNGLACVNGWAEDDEDCQPTAQLGCQQGHDSIDAMICECAPV